MQSLAPLRRARTGRGSHRTVLDGMKATDIPPHARLRAERRLRVRAPAKLNLTLRVLGRRGDGYHDLESLIVPIDLCDELTVETCPGSGWRLLCDDPEVPTDESNLITRAARELVRSIRRRGGPLDSLDGVRVTLVKRIPVGSGLGGGSSDAAATLLALSELLSLGRSQSDLGVCGARVGSDVSFFVHGAPAIVRGRGEQVQPVQVQWPGWFLLICPPLNCQTARVYSHWQPNRQNTDRPIYPFPPDRPLGAEELAQGLFNDLEEPAFCAYPQLSQWHRELQDICPLPLRLTGSGSAFYCPQDNREDAVQLADTVHERFGFAIFVMRLMTDQSTQGVAS